MPCPQTHGETQAARTEVNSAKLAVENQEKTHSHTECQPPLALHRDFRSKPGQARPLSLVAELLKLN